MMRKGEFLLLEGKKGHILRRKALVNNQHLQFELGMLEQEKRRAEVRLRFIKEGPAFASVSKPPKTQRRNQERFRAQRAFTQKNLHWSVCTAIVKHDNVFGRKPWRF
ncbi:Hypp401 [Branchiostoma lanceolatum]|uniref:Hypp401 protein n=1 Tax=Branchiostoma lanceolatum TaxID=7740 RepID=A0A8J9YPI1_BRALA|nr:Hypp401 [Branchiostoma lanceolatum]